MSEIYTTALNRQTNDLSDVYYMSCVASSSNEGEMKEFPLAGTVVKIALVATLTTGANNYTAQAKEVIAVNREVPVMTISGGWQMNKPLQMMSERIGNITLEVNQAPAFLSKTRKAREADADRMERAQRAQMLMTSYQKNQLDEHLSLRTLWTMRMVNSTLCKLPFTDSILQYDKYDDVWQYNLYFDHDLELSVSVYVEDDGMSDVDFSVYHQRELLVSNALPLLQVVKKMSTVLTRVQRNA